MYENSWLLEEAALDRYHELLRECENARRLRYGEVEAPLSPRDRWDDGLWLYQPAEPVARAGEPLAHKLGRAIVRLTSTLRHGHAGEANYGTG